MTMALVMALVMTVVMTRVMVVVMAVARVMTRVMTMAIVIGTWNSLVMTGRLMHRKASPLASLDTEERRR